MNIEKWKSMSSLGQTIWLEENAELSRRSESQRGLVRGVGINDATYCVATGIDGKKVVCPCYAAWSNMLERAYGAKYHAEYPTYSGVVVCDEWHSFMAFRKWWINHHVDCFALDKDILSDDGVYSPATCLFVPSWLNSFTTDCGSARGEWPIGVCLDKKSGKFRAKCCNPITKKQESLGYFCAPEEANLAWMARKLELASELKSSMDEINQRIYRRVVEIIMRAR